MDSNYLLIVEEVRQLKGETKNLKDLVSNMITTRNTSNNIDHTSIYPRDPSNDLQPEFVIESVGKESSVDTLPDPIVHVTVSDSSMTSIDSSILNECPLNLN